MMNHFVYEHVFLIGVDGAGSFFRQADTPNIDRIFADGAVNHHVETSIPSISAQCWGSMLHGVTPSAHRLSNYSVGNDPLPPDYRYPSVFKAARKYYPDADFACISGWNPINVTIVEDTGNTVFGTGTDDEVCDKVCDVIGKKNPKLLFVQFNNVDTAGHSFGYGNEKHLEAISRVDMLIGRIFDAAKKCGELDDTLFLVTADHGGTPEHDHGGTTDAELYVSFFAKGKSVIPGCFGEMKIRDTASIIAFALGFKQPEVWSSRLPDGLFTDGISFERKTEAATDGTKRYSERLSSPTPTENGKRLEDCFDMKLIRCYLPFDGNCEDKTGITNPLASGKIYYTEGFFGSAATLDDGEISLGSVDFGTTDFTLSCWIKSPKGRPGERWNIFNSYNKNSNPGTIFYIEGDSLCSEIGAGSNGVISYSRLLPDNYENNWFHFLVKYHRRTNELCYYYDFCLDCDWYSDIKIPADFVEHGDNAVIGGCCPLTIDDFIIYTRDIDDCGVTKLKDYYEQKTE